MSPSHQLLLSLCVFLFLSLSRSRNYGFLRRFFTTSPLAVSRLQNQMMTVAELATTRSICLSFCSQPCTSEYRFSADRLVLCCSFSLPPHEPVPTPRTAMRRQKGKAWQPEKPPSRFNSPGDSILLAKTFFVDRCGELSVLETWFHWTNGVGGFAGRVSFVRGVGTVTLVDRGI